MPEALRRGLPRWLEVTWALCGLALCSPILAIASLGVKLSSPGPVLFKQRRVGRAGRTFCLIKFRTMKGGEGGPQVTSSDDKRITSVGRLLRKTKIDELPELWNVVKGDISLVGPRPEVPGHVDLSDPLWQRVLEVRPGITDPVTLRLRSEEELMGQVEQDREEFYLKVLQRYKLKGYLQYLEIRTFWSDIRVLVETVLAVVIASGAPSPTLDEVRAGA